MSRIASTIDDLERSIQRMPKNFEFQRYPFSCFLIGYYWRRINRIEHVMYFVQSIQFLLRRQLINRKQYKQILTMLDDFPQKVDEINSKLRSFRQGQLQNIDIQIQNLYSDTRIKRQKPKPLQQQFQGTQELDGNSLQKMDGTLELDQLLNEPKIIINQIQDKDSELARKMQQQFDKQINNKCSSQQQVLCQICYCDLYSEHIDGLDLCGHLFHNICLTQTFKPKILSNQFPLICPEQGCKTEATELDLKRILSSQLFAKYQDHTLKAYAQGHGESISWCPTADCGYMFFFQSTDKQRFQCLQCKKQYCLNCRVEWHKDMSCKEYKVSSTVTEDDQKFLKFVAGKKFKQCPKCKFWVEKNEGCDHMTCKCKFQFCYKCGGVYMKCQCMQKMRKQQELRRQQFENRRKLKQQRRADAIQKRRIRQQQRQQREARKRQKQQQNKRSSRSSRRRKE